MGLWVEKFNSTKPVEYVHSLRFCQFGCIEDYFTAHYQSPRQMMCLWDKLQRQARPQCCNMRWYDENGGNFFDHLENLRDQTITYIERVTSFAVIASFLLYIISSLRVCTKIYPFNQNSFIIYFSLFCFLFFTLSFFFSILFASYKVTKVKFAYKVKVEKCGTTRIWNNVFLLDFLSTLTFLLTARCVYHNRE